MSIEKNEPRRRAEESAEDKLKRQEQGAEEREAGRKADDANVQRMIEQSIKNHGA
jgi:hypothetical protein